MIFMTYRQQREPAKSIHIWNKASQEESVVRVVIELESMQECEGLFQTEALKTGSEIIQGWRPFLPILMLIPLVSPRYLNSYVTSFNIFNQSAHVTVHVTADPPVNRSLALEHVHAVPVAVFWRNVPNMCGYGPRNDDDASLTDSTMAAS